MSAHHIPENPTDRQEVLSRLHSLKEGDADWKSGKTWSLVYHHSDEHSEFVKQAYASFISENGLNPMAFPSLKRMEHEVVRMGISLLSGNDDCVGTMTSGGTESCLLAAKTWRDYARSKKPWIRKPEVLVAETVHVAWQKAFDYFDLKPVFVKLENYRLDPKDLARKIGRNTILIVASAPEYPHGQIDPITEIGAIAKAKSIPLHVDACVGGFFLPFLRQNGVAVPDFDFTVPGVSSISADIHKYGFAAKGASLVLYRSMDFMEHQFYVHTDWPGGVFMSPTMLGTRPGGAVAAAWAALHALGQKGYRDMAAKVAAIGDRLKAGIRSIDGLEIVGEPVMPVFAYRSTDPKLDIYAVADRLEAKGWHIDRLQKPEALHMMVTPAHETSSQIFLTALAQSAVEVRANPSLARKGDAAMYGTIARVPLRGLVKSGVLKLIRGMYGAENKGAKGASIET